ncbi:MAG TPA: hypothetical protein VJQ84_00600 [Solirubrobacterales bacterium]|nr:hypothetical protein [Solirubrobacterales bacterium]
MSTSPATHATEPDLAGAFFERLSERFEEAAVAVREATPATNTPRGGTAGAGSLDLGGTAGAGSLDLEMAGLPLRLRYAGEALRAHLLAPFEHLAASFVGGPALTISAFDTASSGIEPPAPLWEPIEAAPGTNPIVRLRSERACVLAAAGSRALTAAELAAGAAVFHLPDGSAVPASERAAPIREALQLLMAARGRLMTHAGAVGRDGSGVLLVGRGGSGKSTLALSCALAGMEIVADDYVLFEPASSTAHAMQSTAKLTEDSAARLGVPPAAIDPAGFEPTLEGPAKALVDIRTLAPATLKRHLKVQAIVAPSLTPARPHGTANIAAVCGLGQDEPSIRPISAAEGLRAVAPSTIVQSGFGGEGSLATLAELVRRVPSYGLDLSPDPAANAAAVDRLVSELG